MNAITTATITVHPFGHKIICTAVGITFILEDLTRTEQMESS